MSKRGNAPSEAPTRMASAFPPDFLWGGVLSAHCVEGQDTNSDWWHWEQRPGRILGGAVSDPAAAFYQRFRDDIPRFQNLGLNALCLSISWARVAPTPDHIDEAAVQHYRALAEALRAARIRPFVVLWDRALPEWFVHAGAWRNPAAADWFTRYVETMAQTLGPLCRDWIPYWLPETWLHQVYTPGSGPVPPELGWRHSLALRRQLLHAWARACAILRASNRDNRVGASIAYSLHWPRDRYSLWDTRLARLRADGPRHWWNHYTQASGARPDFLLAVCRGMRRSRFSPAAWLREAVLHSAPSEPPGGFDQDAFYTLVDGIVPTEVPVFVTVDGVSGPEAQETQICELTEVLESVLEGASPVHGLFYQPVLDGFQWKDGYAAPRGLIHVHPQTQSRTPNPAAFLLRDIIASGGLRTAPLRRRPSRAARGGRR